MAAPTLTERPAPTGVKLDDGYQTLVAFENDAGVGLWEKTVTPPGLDGGEAIDTSTMHNTDYRTFSTRQLKTLTEMTMVCAYDPEAYDSLNSMINVEQALTVHMPDGSAVAFFGALRTFVPGEHAEGAQPTATCAVQPTNVDPLTGAEESPVYFTPSGTAV